MVVGVFGQQFLHILQWRSGGLIQGLIMTAHAEVHWRHKKVFGNV